jgi:hypothetical protein
MVTLPVARSGATQVVLLGRASKPLTDADGVVGGFGGVVGGGVVGGDVTGGSSGGGVVVGGGGAG